jgi:hypothetical protein
MLGLFVYVNFRLRGHRICSLLLSCGRGTPTSCGRDSAAIGFLALGYFGSFLAGAWLLEVSAVLRNGIRIDLLSSSTRSVCKRPRVRIVEIPLFRFTLVSNHDILMLSLSLSVGILPSVKNRDAHRIDSFVVIDGSFYHSLRQSSNRIRIGMIDISLIYWLLYPGIQFDFGVSALCLFLTVLIVLHVQILLKFAQVLLRLRNHRFQL